VKVSVIISGIAVFGFTNEIGQRAQKRKGTLIEKLEAFFF
jgi:hypothetical protein